MRAQVRGRMQQLKEALFAKVAAVLDPAARPADAAVPGAVAAGRWRAVFDKGARLWSRSRGGGGGGAGADARAELQRQLEDLHADIQGQISAEARPPPAVGPNESRFRTWLVLGRMESGASCASGQRTGAATQCV